MAQYKTNPVVIVLVVIITAVVVGGGVYWYNKSQLLLKNEKVTDIKVQAPVTEKTLVKTAEPKVEVPAPVVAPVVSKVSVADIRAAFTDKYPDRDYSNYTITIDKSSNDLFAEGSVGAPTGGGSHYWAANVNGLWLIVETAQDKVSCDIFKPYGFPKEIIGNDCF